MSTTAPNLFNLYLLLGPVAWLVLGVLMLAGRRRMALLERGAPAIQNPPKVSIIIPAKDEEAGIADCIRSVLAQDYPNFQIVAINDRSADRTGAILDELAKHDPRLRVLHVEEGSLPPGWTGKCNAIQQAWQGADGEWIFFVDSDVLLAPEALSRMLGVSLHRKYDFLSVLTRLECRSFSEKLILPLTAGSVSYMYAVSMTNADGRRGNAFANGQCMLVRNEVYGSVGGHGAVHNLITEDVELARLLKRKGHKVRLGWGGQIASTRMYASIRQMFRGWGRIYSGMSRRRPWRILAAMLVVLLTIPSAYAAAAWGAMASQPEWLVAAGIHWAVMTLVVSQIYASSGNPRRYALLLPAGVAVLLAIYAFALKWCITGRVEWRGTAYDQNADARPGTASA